MESTNEIQLLIQIERKWNEALANNLVEEMGKYMHEDWIIFSGDGNITTKEMFLTLVKKGELIHTKMDFEVIQVRIYNDTGLVIQRGTSAGVWKGQSFSNNEISSSVFIRRDNKWLAVQTMIAPAD